MTPLMLSHVTLTNPNPFALLADWRWFRPGASTIAPEVDSLFFWITAISVFFFVLIVALMALFMWRYRKRPGHREEHSSHHNNTLEIAWSVVPLILVVWIFYAGFTGYIDMRIAPDDAYNIEVTAQKWSWSFKYPTGAISSELHVPKDTPVKLILSSNDVIHSLYIPAFRVKMDCVPGRYTEMWFEATKASTDVSDPTFDNDPEVIGYDLFCAEYCGDGHSSMITKCVVHEPADFDKWMKKALNVRDQGSPVEVGELLYKRRGCTQCHANVAGGDKPNGGGPSFVGHFGETVQFTDGTSAKVDDNYIRESILYPQKKIRAGYQGIMPTFMGLLNDDEIYALRQYIRSLNDKTPEDWAPLPEGEGEEASGEKTSDEDASDGESGKEPSAKEKSADKNDAGDSPAEASPEASEETAGETE